MQVMGKSSEFRAASVLVVASFGFAAVMLGLAFVGGRSPLVLGAFASLGSWLGFLLAFVVVNRDILSRDGVLPYLLRRLATPLPFLTVLGYYDYVVLAYAFGEVAPELVGVVFEVWPLWVILVVSRFTGAAYNPLGWGSVAGVLAAFAGVVLVMAGASGGVFRLWGAGVEWRLAWVALGGFPAVGGGDAQWVYRLDLGVGPS